MADQESLTGPREGELLPRIAAGEVDAFTELFRRHSAEVFRFAWHMTGSRPMADDVTQEVFFAVMREAGRYTPGISSEAAWLRGIARNHVRRRLDCERPALALPEDEDADPDPGGGEGDQLRDLVRTEQIEAVRRAVATLPVRYREVVVLCDLHERSYAEAAGTLGCAIGTVRSRLSRGRALLASKLGIRPPVGAGGPGAAVEVQGDDGSPDVGVRGGGMRKPVRLTPGEAT